MKIALIGNSEWQNRRKIQETLHGIKNRFGEEAVVIGAGGNEGANFMIRKYTLEFGMKYIEYNPSFSGYNLYSAMPETYYGKKYHFSQLHHRMNLIADQYMAIWFDHWRFDQWHIDSVTNFIPLGSITITIGILCTIIKWAIS